MTRAATTLSVAILLAMTLQAQQARDTRRTPDAGRGAIVGVVSDALSNQPLRRAHVTVRSSELELARTTITSDDGLFRIEGLPPGRYSLTAGKDGHVTMNFGASRPGRPGRTVQVPHAATIRVDVRLPRGGVITGTVMNRDGEPAPAVTVMALASTYVPSRGERQHSTLPNWTVVTDDRGIYRIFGLPAGTYLVAAVPRPAGVAPLGAQVMDPAEVREALIAVRDARTAARPGIPTPPPLPPAPAEARTSVVLAPVYFPGTTVLDGALAITLGAGEVRTDVNMDLDYVPTATVAGLVTVPDGMRVQLTLTNTERIFSTPSTRLSAFAGSEGQFAFRGIPPGSYTILARAFPADVRRMTVPEQTILWGETQVMVAGQDVSGVTIGLNAALSISGHLVFDGGAGVVPDLGLVRLPFRAFSTTTNSAVTLPSVVVNGSRFTIDGVLPGTYRFTSPPQGIRSPVGGWWLQSVSINGREVLDGELELRESSDDAVITFSSQASELSGTVQDAEGAPVIDGYVVVFPTDDRFWFHNSRRVAGAPLSDAGRYVVRNLPAGDYRIAVSDDIDFNEWFDPEMLRALVARSMEISLGEAEVKALALTVPAGR